MKRDKKVSKREGIKNPDENEQALILSRNKSYSMNEPTSLLKGIHNASSRYEEHIAKHRKISVPSTDMGTYDFNNPTARPNTTDEGVTVEDLQYIFMTNAVVNKAVHLRTNRIIGDGFELLPADGQGVDSGTAEEACGMCKKFFDKINYKQFFKISCINAYVSGNEWTEDIYNPLGSMVNLAHGDMQTIDFRRNFISNKIIIGSDGQPVGFWQYITDLAQLYYSLSTYYGEIEAYKNLQAAKNRLKESQSLSIRAIDSRTGEELEVGVMFATTKPNYMFIKKEEMSHLAFQTLNDNFYGISLILPAYNAINHLEQVMYATAEAINDMGYPKVVVKVGDQNHPPTQTMNDQAQDLIKNPVRKEGYVIPFFMGLNYLEPSSSGSTSNISQYPEWFMTEVSVGLRTPREVLLGGGEANRATAETNSSDFDRDIQADRVALEAYIYDILDKFLRSRGYLESTDGKSLYRPKIKWPALITADEALKEKMALERWNANAITFNELRTELGFDEVEDPSLGDSYLHNVTAPKENQQPDLGGLLSSNDGIPATENPMEHGPLITGKKAMPLKEEMNPKLNKYFGTEDVDYKRVARESVGNEIKTVGVDRANKIRNAIVGGEARKRSASNIMKDIKKIGKYLDSHARMIFRTEHKNLAEAASLEDAKNKGYTHKQWVSKLDLSTSSICRALDGQTVPIEEDFKIDYEEGGKKKSWSGKGPAAHANCRSFLAYGKSANFKKDGVI